jgi:hypothetical protein
MNLIKGEDEKNRERTIQFLNDVITRAGFTPGNVDVERETVCIVEHPGAVLAAIQGRFIAGVYTLRMTCLEHTVSGKLLALYHTVDEAIESMRKHIC